MPAVIHRQLKRVLDRSLYCLINMIVQREQLFRNLLHRFRFRIAYTIRLQFVIHVFVNELII